MVNLPDKRSIYEKWSCLTGIGICYMKVSFMTNE